ncbi:GAF domain-containing sensor histidine kinase [Hyalangium sp.]|uniref:GAF domain-containing sensor histidine kinase n=1 Tax=Hyalangium sp. TaxID=2028555 RepID=UPI002D405F27|nr:ATP-binding protein [Hyalangium sp.]HYH94830.1 ATP-binding protein [Hyalangium sp.]
MTRARRPGWDALSLVKAQQALSSEINLQKLVATLMSVALQSAEAQRGALVLSQGDELQVKAVVDASSREARAVPRQPADQELPWTVLSYVRRTGEHVLVDDTSQPHPFSADPFFSQSHARSLLCLPLTRNQRLHGLLYLENSLATGAFSPSRITLLQHLVSHAVISLENARLYSEVQQAETALRAANEALEVRVEERQRELKQAQARLVETARRVGMAEVASNVLHEVGNTLTSMVVFTEQMRDVLASSRVGRVEQVASLLEKNQTQLPDFLTQDPRGRNTVGYLWSLAGRLAKEQEALRESLTDMVGNVERVRSIVHLQQTYAKSTLLAEECELAEVVEEALRLQQSVLQQAGIQVTKELEPLPRIRVEDNGQGIAPEARERLFSQGFSTRREGHGLGLHSSVLAAQLMGGQLTLESPGPGQGATATLMLPISGAHAPTETAERGAGSRQA